MNPELSETQKQLKAAAREFLKNECPLRVVRAAQATEEGYSRELWHTMAGLGWLNMVFPAQYGGEDASLLDLAVIYEETGRVLLPSPHLTSVVLSGLTILEAGDERQKAFFLPKIGCGETIVSLAIDEPDFGWGGASLSTSAVTRRKDFVINGTKLFIPYAHQADFLLCLARTGDSASGDGSTLFMVDKTSAGLKCRRLSGYLGEPLCEVVFDNVRVPPGAVLGEVNRGWHHLSRPLETGRALQCCEMVGGGDYVLQMTIDYSRQRTQFGEYIGSFQRVQDRIIDMLNELDAARLTTYEAVWKLSEGLPCDLEIAVAKAVTGAAFARICDESHYVHAGIGFMADYDLHLYTQKARTVKNLLGGPTVHRRRIAAGILK